MLRIDQLNFIQAARLHAQQLVETYKQEHNAVERKLRLGSDQQYWQLTGARLKEGARRAAQNDDYYHNLALTTLREMNVAPYRKIPKTHLDFWI